MSVRTAHGPHRRREREHGGDPGTGSSGNQAPSTGGGRDAELPPHRRRDGLGGALRRLAVDAADLLGVAARPLQDLRRDLDDLAAAVLPYALAVHTRGQRDLVRSSPVPRIVPIAVVVLP